MIIELRDFFANHANGRLGGDGGCDFPRELHSIHGQRVAGAARAAAEDLERVALAAISDADLAGFRAVTRALSEVPR